MAENATSEAPAEAASSPQAAPSGFKAYIPLLVSVIAMPVLAYATTRFVLLPKLESAIGQSKGGAAAATAPAASKEGGTGTPGEKTKVTVPMTKLLVNVAGTMGTRYLMTSVTLVGNTPDFKSKIEDNMDQLKDLATGTLGSKTIADLEKPGARNLIRSELMTVFNNALGGPVVQEIYITELAIQ